VKKSTQYRSAFKKDFEVKSDLEIDKIKTTNVNVLLNRVRLDKKRTLRKRITFSVILVTLVSLLATYFII
tara:strand:+ start:563 stop:772 length:210 start_codon:yes stop_codon:yes gene_type:complete